MTLAHRTRITIGSVAATAALIVSPLLGAMPASAAAPSTPPPGSAIADSHYTLLDFDSESAPYPAPPSLDGTAAGAFDGDYSTQWASNYNGGDPDPMPHYLTFDTGAEHVLTGLGYSVKVQGNGPAKDVEVFTTNDPTVAKDGTSSKWVEAGTATFQQPTSNTQIQYVTFDAPVTARYVEFKVLDAINGSDNASASEVVAYSTDDTTSVPAGKAITNAQYSVVGEDSQQNSSGDGSAASAFDQSYTTQWASRWSSDATAYPHWITFDVGGSFDLTGLGYSVKVQNNGPIADAKVFTTDDATVAKDPAASGWTLAGTATLLPPKSDTQIQYVTFSTPVKARFVRFEAEDAVNDSNNASASELVVYSTDADTTPSAPPGPPSPYTVTTDSVDANTWKHADDTAPSPYIDKDGTFHFEEAHSLYSKTDSRAWTFYTGSNMDTATKDTAISSAGTNPDTTAFCDNSPTGKEATVAAGSTSHSQANYCDLTQMWIDPDTGDWYGLVHNEFTPEPFKDGLHYDSIDYAVSTDQGKTWSIPGHAITSPYSTKRDDNTAFPQQTYYYGDGDQRLYVDYASGYFYAFYGSRVVNKGGGWVAFYEHVARAPIADKMATGSWEKWYDGTWTQPGIGGKESNMTPITDDSQTGYTAPDKEYDPTTQGTGAQQIQSGKMPATSPLFVMDVTYDAYLGLYISEPQNPDQSGKAGQEFYATKSLATQKWFKLGDTGKDFTTASWYRLFLDPANKTNAAIVGKSFRSYCTFGCMNGSSAQIANVTIDGDTPAAPIDTTKAYAIANGSNRLLTVSSDGASVTSSMKPDKASGAWTFAATGDGAYTIADQAGALLGVDSSTTAGRAWGAPLSLTAQDAAGVGQQWFVVQGTSATTGDATGTVRLVNRYSGLVLGVGNTNVATTPARSWDQKASAADGVTTVGAQTLSIAEYQEGATTPPSIDAPSSAQAGAPLTVGIHGFTPGAKVTVVLHSDPLTLGTATADASGDGSVTATVPADFATGDHVLQASVDGEVVASQAITITAQAVPGETGGTGAAPGQAGAADQSGLAATGSDLLWPIGAGILLVIAGGAITVLRMRRRRESLVD